MSLFSLFLITSLANILSPGMGVIFAIVLSLQQGWHKTVFFSLGQAIGISILFTAAMSGMGVVLANSPTLFNVIKIAGAFFILYLGWRSWHKPAMHFGTSPDKEKSEGRHAVPEDGLANFTKGIVISLCNPQPIIFGISVLPQFVDPQQPYVAQAVLMISVYAVMVFIKYGPYSADVSIWCYSIISIAVSLIVGIPASMIWRAVKGDKSVPAPHTTIYKD